MLFTPGWFPPREKRAVPIKGAGGFFVWLPIIFPPASIEKAGEISRNPSIHLQCRIRVAIAPIPHPAYVNLASGNACHQCVLCRIEEKDTIGWTVSEPRTKTVHGCLEWSNGGLKRRLIVLLEKDASKGKQLVVPTAQVLYFWFYTSNDFFHNFF